MHIQNQQGKLQQQHDKSRVKRCELSSRDSVNVWNTQEGVEKWVPGTVITRLGPLTYLVKVGRQLRYVSPATNWAWEFWRGLRWRGFWWCVSRGASCSNVVSKVDIWYINISKCCYHWPEPETESPCKVPMQTPKHRNLEHKVPVCQLQEIWQIGPSADIQSGTEKHLLS